MHHLDCAEAARIGRGASRTVGRIVGWSGTIDGIEGPVGDALAIRVVAEMAPDPATDEIPDMRDHEWVAKIRWSLRSSVAPVEMDLLADNTTATTVDLLFGCSDTSWMTPGHKYVMGVRATGGMYAGWTVIKALSLTAVGSAAL